ncbi:hypothetical protein L486_02929 [Kwoniella mangroviensis CBS 10435]|uniref:TauD/TfdA-like domain-containing protein n=1 Tax=Kwoniella mangroviensis CBS 10435 TaxID=1331196 RepID=A0A1B9IXJ6_9TREE|nr:hypothetical protein L486_02929 [Kwoniella mangroviensis CBS 10435]
MFQIRSSVLAIYHITVILTASGASLGRGGRSFKALKTAEPKAVSALSTSAEETPAVVHSGVAQADFSRAGNRGGVIRREPVENVHPLVRKHPVTGEKALFVNKQFSRYIVGLKSEESDSILELLYTHIAQGHDFQIRAKWKPKTVVLWDNRITAQTAIGDYSPERDGFRHGSKINPQAERPFL